MSQSKYPEFVESMRLLHGDEVADKLAAATSQTDAERLLDEHVDAWYASQTDQNRALAEIEDVSQTFVAGYAYAVLRILDYISFDIEDGKVDMPDTVIEYLSDLFTEEKRRDIKNLEESYPLYRSRIMTKDRYKKFLTLLEDPLEK